MTLDIASSNCDGDSCLDVVSDLPVDIKLDDEVRLDRVKFKEEDRNKDTNSVSLVEQCILLGNNSTIKFLQYKVMCLFCIYSAVDVQAETDAQRFTYE